MQAVVSCIGKEIAQFGQETSWDLSGVKMLAGFISADLADKLLVG